VTRGQLSPSQTVTVTNTGGGTLTFNTANAFALGGTNPTQYRLTTSAPCVNGGTLAPAAKCTVTVVFAPTGTPGAKRATVTVGSNAANGTQTVTLTGTAR
jgi:hypothetical protein